MAKFCKPGTPEPKKRLVAPATFSRLSAGSLSLVGTVAGADIVEDAQDRARRLKRRGVVQPAAPRSPAGACRAQGCPTPTKTSPNKMASSTPWWVQNRNEVYISQKIKHKRELKIKDDAQNEVLLAHAALLKQREDEAAQRKSNRLAAERAASVPMPMKIEKMVVMSKMRDKDIRRDILDVNKKLEEAASKRTKNKQTLKSAVELIKLKEEELMLTRERMVHLYRSASDLIVKQSQQIGGAEDEDLAAFLDRKKDVNAPLINEMVSHRDMCAANALYEKYNRIEELWAKLRNYTFTVGKVELRRKRAIAMKASQQRVQYHQAITESIYNIDSFDNGPPKHAQPVEKVSASRVNAGRKGSTYSKGPPSRKASTIGSPPPSSSPAWGSQRKTLGIAGRRSADGGGHTSGSLSSPPSAVSTLSRTSSAVSNTAPPPPPNTSGPSAGSARPPVPPPS